MTFKRFSYLKQLFTKFAFLIFAMILIPISQAFSQVNLKIGYTVDYANHSINNKIFKQYNSNNTWLTNGFEDMHFSHGVQFGARLKKDFLALDLNWERLRNDKESSGFQNNGTAISTELNYTFNRFSLGIESYKDFLGIGANINYTHFLIKSSSPNLGSAEKLLTSGDFGNKIYLIFSTEGSNVLSISFQPFIQIPWTGPNLFGLNNYLKNESHLSTYNQNNLHFGLSVIFYNGPQN